MHYAWTYLLHKAIVSSFSSHRGPEQKQNWDVNHERGTATRQLLQLCQILFICSDSDSFPQLSLLSAKMPLTSKTMSKEIFPLASPSQEIQLWRKNKSLSRKRDQARAVGRKSYRFSERKLHRRKANNQKNRDGQWKQIAHGCDDSGAFLNFDTYLSPHFPTFLGKKYKLLTEWVVSL